MSDDLGTPNLTLERRGPIGWLTIDRPHARNALTGAMYFGITRAVALANRDPDLHALVLTGTGDVFAPGGEMGGRQDEGEDPTPPGGGSDVLPFEPIRNSRTPVISAVNGICMGGGLTIAMVSDVTVASERATFRGPELLRGVVDAYYAAYLPAHVGLARAREFMLTARVLEAHEARQMGLIARVVAHDELEEAAEQTVREVLQTAPEARAQFKRILNERYGHVDRMSFEASLTTDEVAEGFRAFVERRAPAWVPEAFRAGERL